MNKIQPSFASFSHKRRKEGGQALIYGLFILVGGLATLVFLFNDGQLIGEKTKLVNAADAVVYSAGAMHARALNFTAYTNRALMANEVMIAQAVSIASWTQHVVEHTKNVPPLYCYSWRSVPVALALIEYVPACALLSLPGAISTASSIDTAVQVAATSTVSLSELAKTSLQAAQLSMALTLIPSRALLMQQVADANYTGDGVVKVDSVPITDNFSLFDGEPFIRSYSGDDRGRFKDAATAAANRDSFVTRRSWTSRNFFPCFTGLKAEFRRRGGTELIGFDEWKAMDTASLHRWSWHFHFFRGPSCDENEYVLGDGTQAAANGVPDDSAARYGNSRSDNPAASSRASSSDWGYSGLPTFYDLSVPALKYLATDSNPRLKFSIRLTRALTQTRTSDGTSLVKPTGRFAIIDGKPAFGVLAAVATSEVFFQRPVARADGRTELASLFNPYWQVHLVQTSAADVAQAVGRGGPK